MLSFAQRFIVGRDAADALPKLRALRQRGIGFTLDVLGEASVGDAEAVDYQQRYLISSTVAARGGIVAARR